MWAYARVELKLSSKEFYALTPRQYSLLVKQRERSREIESRPMELMLAQLTAMVANTAMRPIYDSYREPKDFMLSRDVPVKKKRANRKAFSDQLRRTMERLVAYQNGQAARGL